MRVSLDAGHTACSATRVPHNNHAVLLLPVRRRKLALRELCTVLKHFRIDHLMNFIAMSHYPWRQRLADYYALCKPRVIWLMLLTVVVGMLLATTELVHPQLLLMTNLGIACCAAGAAAFNHLLEMQIDQRMYRTRHRPVASGRVSLTRASGFALVMIGSGSALLYFQVNPLTTWLTLATVVGYALIYTCLLKRRTPQNIVIGGLSGAMPPALGWAAVTNTVTAEAWLLVLIIFLWTPPHFWALAIHRVQDYRRVDIPMLTNTHGEDFTRLQILLYSILLALATIFPYIIGMSGVLYFYAALLLNAIFIKLAFDTYQAKTSAALRLFRYSISYLTLLFVALLADHWIL